MLSQERYSQLMEEAGMPDSVKLFRVLKQAVTEATIIERERCYLLCKKVENNTSARSDAGPPC